MSSFKYSRSLCDRSRVTVDYFNTKNSLSRSVFLVQRHNWRKGYHTVESKLKEVFRRGVIAYFITNGLVMRLFRGIATYCFCLKTMEGYCSQMIFLPPIP